MHKSSNKTHKYRTIPGINIQWPWSQMILSGDKIIETRSYPIPEKYIGRELAIIETPGPRGRVDAGINKARIVGTVVFSGSKVYENASEWQSDFDKHLVKLDDPQFKFESNGIKWGWKIESIQKLSKISPAPKKRGIIFAKKCLLKQSLAP